MKAHERMNYEDKVRCLINVTDLLRFDGYFAEAQDLDEVTDTMEELIERLRSLAANDG